MSLEVNAMRWLWLQQKCWVVLEQRTPMGGWAGQPDVIGVTPGRYITEIEVKRTLADFRADAFKPHRRDRRFRLKHLPRQIYYLAPKALTEKVKSELPDWAGLLEQSENGWQVEVVVRAPLNTEAQKLNLDHLVRLSRMMTSHVMGYAAEIDGMKQRWGNNDSTLWQHWVPVDAGVYEI